MKRLNTLLLILCICFQVYGQTGEEIFVNSGVFTVPDGVTEVTIEVIGAGGSGGGNGTGGGGGGGYASGNYTVTPAETLNVNIGIPDLGALIGTTYVGILISATGGVNGISVPNPEIGGGGAPGMGIGGNISNYSGGNGGGGYYTYFGGGGGGAAGPDGDGGVGGNTIAWTGICLTPGGDGGINGGAPAGNGGKGAGFIDAICGISDPSAPGVTYGGGGGGGNGNGGGPGAGAAGYCRISWCSVDVGIVGNDESISANATDVSYQWINCNGNTNIADATAQIYTPTETGDYAVIINNGICSDTSECYAITVITIGIETALENSILVSPNPFTSYLQIENGNINDQYTLINALGQIIWSGKNIEKQDFTFVEKGMYLLKIENKDRMQIVHLIK